MFSPHDSCLSPEKGEDPEVDGLEASLDQASLPYSFRETRADFGVSVGSYVVEFRVESTVVRVARVEVRVAHAAAKAFALKRYHGVFCSAFCAFLIQPPSIIPRVFNSSIQRPYCPSLIHFTSKDAQTTSRKFSSAVSASRNAVSL